MDSSEYIPVIENERRNYPHPERRKSIKSASASDDRRRDDRRRIPGVSRNELDHITSVLREEQKILIDFISDKEKQKQQVFRFQVTAIVLLAASFIAVLPIFEKFIGQSGSSTSMSTTNYLNEQVLLLLFVFNGIGLVGITLINFMSAAVAKQITSIKINIILAARQLNCNREAIQDAIAARLCGVYPVGKWRDTAKTNKWQLAHHIYVRHNKFPIDNEDVRKFYMRRHINRFISFIAFFLGSILNKYN